MADYNFPFSGLLFDEEEHRYYFEGRTLKSVTTLLKETLFKDKYSDVDPNVLANAAKFGTSIHKMLEKDATLNVDELRDVFCGVHNINSDVFVKDSDMYELFNKACKVYGMATGLMCYVEPLANEYLVTDGRIAGSIDRVGLVDGKLTIIDYKFTYNADIEYLSWQESIYAYLFEKMTGQRIEQLMAVWVPKRDASLGWFNPIPRKSDEDIEALISGSIVTKDDTYPVAIKEAQMALANIIIQEKEIAERKKMLQETLCKFMEENGVKQIKSDYYTISYIAPSKRKQLDKDAFKKLHPDIDLDLEVYSKITNVKSTVKISVK